MSALDIAQLAHAEDECILCREGSDAIFPNDFGEDYIKVPCLKDDVGQ